MRPRSWWSCSRPKRSASSITITVALGTSTPTSMTVVATSTSVSPSRNARIAASLSAAGIWPCSSPSRRSASSSACSRSSSSVAARASSLSRALDQRAHDVGLAPVRHLLAHLLVHRDPLEGPAADDRRSRSASGRPAGGAARSCRGRRRSASPRCAGSGVAVITSTSGESPLARSRSRCSTPKRCCSSITATPRRANSTPP